MENLFKDFSPATAADWKARLEKDLKGITYDQLSLTDRNGITIHPFYTPEDTVTVAGPVPVNADWNICSRIEVTDAARANKEALDQLNNGASGLIFNIHTGADPAVLLQEIALPYIYTRFVLHEDSLPFAAALQAYLATQGWQAASMSCHVSYDCTGQYLQGKGNHEHARTAFLEAMKAGHITLDVNASIFQNAGAHATYELACALAQVNEYLQLLDDAGQLQTPAAIHVCLATDTGFFEQIAKLRAFRLILSLLQEQYHLDLPVHLHVETSNTYRAPFDSYSNLLRDTIAGMAAVLGGCNSLYIHPFNESLQAPDDFSRRMSRNQQLIFKEESYLDKVADVAAGSYYLESLTEQVAHKAWEQFKAIEQEGGLAASFGKGILEQSLSEQAQQLVQEYKEGKRVLIGVNKFPNAKDEPVQQPVRAEHTGGIQPLSLTMALMS